MIATAMLAAATKSMVMLNGGHHLVLATKWLRCFIGP
jgi:hypothetical protein